MQSIQELLGLWYHESCRVFQDRLVNDEDRDWFESLLSKKMQEDYNVNMDDVVTKRPFLFCDFLSGGDREDREYVYVEDHAKVSVFSLLVLTACFLRLFCLRSLFNE